MVYILCNDVFCFANILSGFWNVYMSDNWPETSKMFYFKIILYHRGDSMIVQIAQFPYALSPASPKVCIFYYHGAFVKAKTLVSVK